MDSCVEDKHLGFAKVANEIQPIGMVNEAPINWMNNLMKITSGTLSTGTAISFQPSAILNLIPYVQSIAQHRYGRWGYKVKIVLNPTVFHYGYVMVVAVPWITTPLTTARFSEHIWDYNPVLLDLASTQEVTLDLPYNCPSPMLDLTSTYTEMWQVCLYPEFTRVNSTVTTAIPYTIYVQLTSPQFCMARLNSVFEDVGLEAQADVGGERFFQTETLLGAGAAAAAAVGAAYDYYKVGNGVGQEILRSVNTLSTIKKHMANEQEIAVNEEHDKMEVSTGVFSNMSSCIPTPTSLDLAFRRGQYINPKLMNDSTIKHSIASVVQTPTLLWPVGSSKVSMVATDFRVISTLAPGYNSVFVLDGRKLTYMDYMARCFRFWRGSFKLKFFLFTSPLISGIFSVRVTESNVLGDFQNSFRKEVVFKGSTEVEINVPYANMNAYWTSLYEADSQGPYLYYEINGITTTGDITSKVFVLPYIAAGEDFLFASSQSPGCLSTLGEEENTRKSFIRNDVGKRGVVRMQREDRGLEAQSNVREDFKKSFDVMPGMYHTDCAYVMNEVVLTVEELLNRYSTRSTTNDISINTSIVDIVYSPSNTKPNAIDTFDWVASLFEYNRGSIRHKLVAPSSTGVATNPSQILSVSMSSSHNLAATNGFLASAYAGYIGGDGMGVSNTSMDPDFSFTVPYISGVPMRRAYNNAQYIAQVGTAVAFSVSNSSGITYLPLYEFVAAGNDFQLGNLFIMPSDAYLPLVD